MFNFYVFILKKNIENIEILIFGFLCVNTLTANFQFDIRSQKSSFMYQLTCLILDHCYSVSRSNFIGILKIFIECIIECYSLTTVYNDLSAISMIIIENRLRKIDIRNAFSKRTPLASVSIKAIWNT